MLFSRQANIYICFGTYKSGFLWEGTGECEEWSGGFCREPEGRFSPAKDTGCLQPSLYPGCLRVVLKFYEFVLLTRLALAYDPTDCRAVDDREGWRRGA
jgi:hypothetical protein